ncbi:MAG: hypothetical protein ACI9EF_000533 [Pseudohongiellaceae bacterium]|jgi:uncharacterized protein YyaL (SSP411 family)
MTADAHANMPTNRLAGETSPYLLQHQHNPVNWHPWGEEALALARAEDKPIFLSIGYSACHWCHVMERESFEQPELAAVLNASYVSIKVDREERPDLDDIYMQATQALSGHGGWPMSVFLTPQLEPFYAGTYFPPQGRHGLPGFSEVLNRLSHAWKNQREQLNAQAAKVVERMQQLVLSSEHLPAIDPGAERPHLDLVDLAADHLSRSYDRTHGGFGSAPKFPHSDDIRLLLRQSVAVGDEAALSMAEHTLDCMARGGVFDQLGGGFSRYSVDNEWAIPHFEKMLYDNALLVRAYLEAHLITGRADFALVARRCCEWVLREMVDPQGGLWSTQDADSEGEEGRFFAWQRDEVLDVVGREHKRLVDVYWGLSEHENFEGLHWVLLRLRPDEQLAKELGLELPALLEAIEPLRQKLFDHREQRVHPDTDDKVLVSWNGLMISALAKAGRLLDEPRFVDAARAAARFCLTTMRPEGRLLATWRQGKAHINATLADFAYLAEGLLELFEVDGDTSWLDAAIELTDDVRARFADRERAGFFFTSDDHEQLVARPRDLFDGALPSSNAVMADVLVRLGGLTGNSDYSADADQLFAMAEPLIRASPPAFGRMLISLMGAHAGGRTVVISGGSGQDELLLAARAAGDPGLAVFTVPAAGLDDATAERYPLLAGKLATDGRATAYPCRHGSCSAPVQDSAELSQALEGLR